MSDRPLVDKSLDAPDVIPMVVGQPDLGELDAMRIEGGKHGLRLRGVDDRSVLTLNHQIGVVVSETRNGNHLHRNKDRPQRLHPSSRPH